MAGCLLVPLLFILLFFVWVIITSVTSSPVVGFIITIGFLVGIVVFEMTKQKNIKLENKNNEEKLKNIVTSLEKTIDGFSFDEKEIFGDLKSFISVDEQRRKLLIGGSKQATSNLVNSEGDVEWKIIDICKVLNLEIIDNNSGVLAASQTADTLGMAAAGGILFGGAGAVVGAIAGSGNKNSEVSEIILRLSMNDIKMPYIGMNFLASKTLKNSESYKNALSTAEKWFGILSILINREKNKEKS